MPVPEPGDRAVGGDEAAGDDAVGRVGAATFRDAAGSPLAVAVRVEKKGGRHDRVVGGAAFPVDTVGVEERGRVQLLEQLDHEIREMVPGQPLRHVHGEEELLVPVHRVEVVRHRQRLSLVPARQFVLSTCPGGRSSHRDEQAGKA